MMRQRSLAALLLFFPLLGWSQARLLSYKVDPAWPQKPADMAWGDMPGVAVDRQDRIWIFTRAKPAVQIYGADGKFLQAWRDLECGMAHHIKFDAQGNVWLADAGLHIVRKFTPEGKVVMSLGTPKNPGEDERRFNRPTDMAITREGEIFVSDGYGNNRIVHFDRNGKFVKAWGKKGSGPGEFNIPHGIGIDSKGLLYVADRSNARIQVFDRNGKFLAQWTNLLVPWSIWVTAQDEIWTCGSSPMSESNPEGMLGIPPKDQVFMKFNTKGNLLQLWTVPKGVDGQEKPGECNWVHAIAPDSKGNLYVGDIVGKRVQKFVRQP